MMPQADADLEIDPDPQLEREADQAAEDALSDDDPLIVERLGTNVHIQRISNQDRLETIRRRAELEKSDAEIYQEKILEETPVNHVDLTDLTDPELADVFETLLEANERGFLDGLDRITANRKWAQDASISEGGIAGYDLSERTIYFNPDEFTSDQISELHAEGWFATGSIEGGVYHELGHHRHIENLRDSVVSTRHLMDLIEGKEFTADMRERICEEISEYGTKVQPYEFVAEVFSMKNVGEDPPEDLEQQYNQIYDPEP